MNEPLSLTVRTGSRLHFGLWAWGEEHPRQFGGVGMMIEQPEVMVRFDPAEQFLAVGPASERVRQVARRCAEYWGWSHLPSCCVTAVSLPRLHSGLGVGTQLALATARGLAEWQGGGILEAPELALAAGRGARSSIGTHGFDAGGLLVDAGKGADEPLGALEQRVAVPDDWRVVLCMSKQDAGLAGEAERRAFSELPSVPREESVALMKLARDEIVPAMVEGDFARFSDAIYGYGQRAGLCFAPYQGGAYSSGEIASLVGALRDEGIAGVGQSSWGPTVFAMVPSQAAGEGLVGWLTQTRDNERYDFLLTRPKNCGATVEWER